MCTESSTGDTLLRFRIIVLAKTASEARKKVNIKFAHDYPSVKRGQVKITGIDPPNKYAKAQGSTEWVFWFDVRKKHKR